jgi:hypothetical protein
LCHACGRCRAYGPRQLPCRACHTRAALSHEGGATRRKVYLPGSAWATAEITTCPDASLHLQRPCLSASVRSTHHAATALHVHRQIFPALHTKRDQRAGACLQPCAWVAPMSEERSGGGELLERGLKNLGRCGGRVGVCLHTRAPVRADAAPHTTPCCIPCPCCVRTPRSCTASSAQEASPARHARSTERTSRCQPPRHLGSRASGSSRACACARRRLRSQKLPPARPAAAGRWVGRGARGAFEAWLSLHAPHGSQRALNACLNAIARCPAHRALSHRRTAAASSSLMRAYSGWRCGTMAQGPQRALQQAHIAAAVRAAAAKRPPPPQQQQQMRCRRAGPRLRYA